MKSSYRSISLQTGNGIYTIPLTDDALEVQEVLQDIQEDIYVLDSTYDAVDFYAVDPASPLLNNILDALSIKVKLEDKLLLEVM